ncbi:hypothetical protein ACFQHW_08490 [Lapidilactobacillus achengensis]|uniref:Transcriptional regulator n=1 Tax=Lapidilactobacillus achengensis TaxID=2486000 RepID=A0ABW1UNQ0_9LACO|nr:hypothetical protein [Lapidilactobacillus achengensis]
MTQLLVNAVCGVARQDLSGAYLRRYTASELIAKTQISRSAFYQHFDGGLRDVFSTTIENEVLRPMRLARFSWPEAVDFVLNYVRHNQILVRNLYELGSGPQKICWFRQQLVAVIWPHYRPDEPLTSDCCCWRQLSLLCGALVGEIQCWTCSDFKEELWRIRLRLQSFDLDTSA